MAFLLSGDSYRRKLHFTPSELWNHLHTLRVAAFREWVWKTKQLSLVASLQAVHGRRTRLR